MAVDILLLLVGEVHQRIFLQGEEINQKMLAQHPEETQVSVLLIIRNFPPNRHGHTMTQTSVSHTELRKLQKTRLQEQMNIYTYLFFSSHSMNPFHFAIFPWKSIAGKFPNPIVWAFFNIRPCQLSDHFNYLHTPLLAAIVPRSKSLGTLVFGGWLDSASEG